MAYNYAQLVRQATGDAGVWTRDVASGDAATTEFYVSTTPVIGDSQSITVNGAARTEVASSPGATEYTFDDENGRILFGAAPASGTDNIVVVYQGCRISDEAVAEACRVFGLDSTATADVGPPAAVREAAAWLCDAMAAATAGDFDFDADGQSYKRGSVSAAWAARATSLRELARRTSGIVSTPVTRLDGYARRGEYSTRDLGDTSPSNPRRRYYGSEDELP